jgi:glycosyltransferase involved in cell wall biosynthesis
MNPEYLAEYAVKILYIHQYFTTPQLPGGTRSYEFGRRLVDQGHEVTMLTSKFSPEPWSGPALQRTHDIAGMKVVELRAGSSKRHAGTSVPYLQRILSFTWQSIVQTLGVLGLPRHDVVFATSTPLTIGLPGLIAKWKMRVPMVFEVRDLWPEAPIQMGAVKNPLMIKATRWLERFIYKHSDHVVALSPGMADGVAEAGVEETRISIIPNSSDTALFNPEVDGSGVRTELGLEGKFMASYFGAFGEANDLTYVAQAARLLKDEGEQNIVFVLNGHGKREVWLRSFKQEHGLDNLIILEAGKEKTWVAQLAAASDVNMTIYKNVPVLYTCSPNKLFDSLAAGKPVLVNTPGWLADIAEGKKTGVAVEPESPESIVEKLKFLRDNPDLCLEYGKNARHVAETEYSRDILAVKLEKVLTAVAAT